MKRMILTLTILLMSANWCEARHLYPEKDYQKKWCDAHNGKAEFVLNDKARVDCLTSTLAVEFDFAPKWHECIGQAIYYAKKTRRIPACVLIMENEQKDSKYLYRLRYAVYKKKKIMEFRTFTIKPDVLNKLQKIK